MSAYGLLSSLLMGYGSGSASITCKSLFFLSQRTSKSRPSHSTINRHVDKLAMLPHTFDLTHLVVVFTTLIRISSVAALLLSNDGPTKIPHDVIAEMVRHVIRDHDVQPLSGKRQSSGATDVHPTKKRKQIEYDRERAK